MATAKIASLVIRTLAKPISVQLKQQAKEHERFRAFCVWLAQGMYRTEVRLRTNILGESQKHIRPLSETKAIDNGANTLAEGFLFSVAAAVIIGESWRSARAQGKRRDKVDDTLEELGTQVQELSSRLTDVSDLLDRRWKEERARSEELRIILAAVVDANLVDDLNTVLGGQPLRIAGSPIPNELDPPQSSTPLTARKEE